MVNYRLAHLNDNQQLLELTGSTGMPGNMALRIDRYPDFFKLNNLRGETKVYVAVKDDKIIGSICVSDQLVFIDKKRFPLYYVSDLKVSEIHRNQGIGFQLTNMVVDYLDQQNADFAFLNVSKGNKRPFTFFSDRGTYIDYQNIGTFSTYQYIGSPYKFNTRQYQIKLTKPSDEVLDFLNHFYSQYELANVVTYEKVKDSELYVVREEGQILAVMSIIDTMEIKQNLVLKMSWYLNVVVRIINMFCKIFKLSKLPKENEPIKMLYIKYLAVRNNEKALIHELISYAKQLAYNKTYSFVSITMHENDRLLPKLPKYIRFSFKSVGMLVGFKDNKKFMKLIKERMVFRDYSAV